MTGASPDEAERALTDQVESLATDLPSERELEKARNQILAQLVFDSEGVTLAAHQIGYFETLGASSAFRKLPERIAAVAEDDLARVAGRYLTRQRRTIGQYVPTGNGHR